MKNIFAIIFMLFIIQADAQKIALGIIQGQNNPNNYSTQKGVGQLSQNNLKKTFTFGLDTRFEFLKYFSMRSGVIYEERGWKLKPFLFFDPVVQAFVEPDPTDKVDYFYSFITIPTLLELKVGNKIQFFVNGGLHNSIRIGGGKRMPNGFSLVGDWTHPEILKPILDVSGEYGGGIRAKFFSKILIGIEARYYKSYSPIGRGQQSNDELIKHKGYMYLATLHYILPKS